MLCHPKAANNWFRACAQGDKATIERLKARRKGSYDTRPSLGNGSVFRGFAGIHYAAYFNCSSAVTALLDVEYDKLTQYSIIVYPKSTLPVAVEGAGFGGSLSIDKPVDARSKSSKPNKKRNSTNFESVQRLVRSRSRAPSTSGRLATVPMTPSTASIPMYSASTSTGSPLVAQQNTQPFTLGKGSSMLMVAIARGNFKLASTIITWLSRRKDADKNRIIKLQNADSVSALMLLCTMRSSTAAAILQAGELLLLKHEFVLLSKEGKSCLHYCIDTGSEAILETIFRVMSENPAQSEEAYMLKYRLARILLYDRSLPRSKPSRMTPIQSSSNFTNFTSDQYLSPPLEQKADEKASSEKIIDLEGITTSAATQSAHQHQSADFHTDESDPSLIKQQTILDYILYQTGALSEIVRMRIYALVYYYVERLYTWTTRDYIDVCKQGTNMTPDMQLLRHAKRWANFDSRYPKPRVPYVSTYQPPIPIPLPPQLQQSHQDPSSSFVDGVFVSSSRPFGSLHLSPLVATPSSSIRSREDILGSLHRRCVSLTSSLPELRHDGIGAMYSSASNVSYATGSASGTSKLADYRHSTMNQVQHPDELLPPLILLASHSTQQPVAVAMTPTCVTDEDNVSPQKCLRQRTNSVQHLFSNRDSIEATGSFELSDYSAHDLGEAPIGKVDVDTKKRQSTKNDTEDDLVPELLDVSHKRDKDSNTKSPSNKDTDDIDEAYSTLTMSLQRSVEGIEETGTCIHIKLPQSICSDSTSVATASPRTPGSVRCNAFRQFREQKQQQQQQQLQQKDQQQHQNQHQGQAEGTPKTDTSSTSGELSQSYSDFGSTDCNRSIIRLNEQLSFDLDSDSDRTSIVNMGNKDT